jgi:hypothetical protein
MGRWLAHDPSDRKRRKRRDARYETVLVLAFVAILVAVVAKVLAMAPALGWFAVWAYKHAY